MTNYLSSIMKGYVKSYLGLDKACWQGIILSFIESTLIGVYYFLPLYFVNNLQMNIVTSSMLISFYGIGAVFGGLLGGKLSDKTSPGLVTTICLIIQAIVFYGMTIFTDTNLLAIDLFVMGVASYGFITANHLWVLSKCKDHEMKKLTALNLLNVASNLGFGLSAVIISFLAVYGFKNVFYFCSILLCVSAIHFFFLESSENKLLCLNDNTNKIDNDEVISNKGNKKFLWLVLICLFLVGFIIFQSNTTYSIFIQKTFPDFGMQGVGALFALNSIMVVILQAPIIYFFSDYNKVIIMGVGAFLLGLGMFLLNFCFIFTWALFSCMIYTIGEILFFSVAQFICYENGVEKRKGHVLGVYRMVYASSRVVAPTAGAFVFQHYGSNVLWIICGTIGLFCLAACSFIRK